MKESLELELSNFFWNSYKLFLKDKLSLNELRMALTSPDDAVFYCQKCNPECDTIKTIKAVIARDLDVFLEKLFSELESIPTRDEKKAVMQKVLSALIGFGNYSTKKVDVITTDICMYFAEEATNTERLDEDLHSLNSTLSAAAKFVGKEEIVEPILCKLALMYACLAVSDREGAIKCKQLGKELFTNMWFKSIPELVTLSYLKKMVHERLPISEYELLERYSF